MRKSLWNKMLLLSVIMECLTLVASSDLSAQTFSGDFAFYDSSIGTYYVDIPFTIGTHSEASFSYDSLCSNPDNLTILVRSAGFTGDAMTIGIIRGIGESSSPLEGYPLYQGNYIARLFCKGTITQPPPNPPLDPEWNLEVSANPISISFQEDIEPESEIPETVNTTKSYSGWLGLYGTPGESSGGERDYYDTHFLNMKKDTKIKFKIEWGDFTTSNSTDIDFAVLLYRYRDGKVYFVHDFNRLENSGDVTEEITLLEDGVYKVSFGGAAVGFNDDRKRYGGYKATLILNGVIDPPPPPPGLFLTFTEATWVKQPANRVGDVFYHLVIKYNVRSTYNESKRIQHSAVVVAPMINDIFGTTLPTGEIIDSINNSSCETDTTDWSDFCHRQGDMCRVESVEVDSPNSSISASGNEDYVVSVRIDLAGYLNFDDSLQLVKIVITDEDGLTKCYNHGLSFWPVWAMLPLPGVNGLLLNGEGN